MHKFRQKEISYTFRKSKRAKRMWLVVYCDGSVVVTSPFGIQQSLIEKFLADKKQWVLDKIKFFKNLNKKIIRAFSRKDYLDNKNKAFDLVQERVRFYNKIYGFSFNKIFIKNQKTRWGSCSKKGNLNFNYKIMFIPEKIKNYIIIHELCHLGEFNHSKRFWNLVAMSVPDYKKIRAELKKFSASL